jgi:hypothetical protein
MSYNKGDMVWVRFKFNSRSIGYEGPAKIINIYNDNIRYAYECDFPVKICNNSINDYSCQLARNEVLYRIE